MKKEKRQSQRISVLWLLNRGYNISQASLITGYSRWHISEVLNGKRNGQKVIPQLEKLPIRNLVQRRTRDIVIKQLKK